ncbi:hypothetical protein CI102_12442 [Trichoderma harzianum]|nr:hypothetical protein CI102_12442 [Trichoderma harzianum]
MSADSCLPETRPQACHISLPKVYTAHISLLNRKTEAPRSPQHGNGRRCVLFPETVEEGPEDQRGIDPKIAPRMASGFEPPEEFQDRWKDCTVIFGNEELNTVILSPDQQVLVETEEQLIYLKDQDAVIRESEVMKYRVLARCQHLACGPTKKPKAKADGEDVNDNEGLLLSIKNGKSVYIGQSMHMDGPVFASGKNEEKHSAGFDFKGLNLKSEPHKLIIGSGTIPHFAVSSKFNLKKAKQLVHAKSLKSFYRKEWEFRAYNEYAERLIGEIETA